MIRIIGLDPGLRHTGWAVLEKNGTTLSIVSAGIINPPPSERLGFRLRIIFEELSTILEEHKPDEAAIEETFVNKNAESTLKLGHARAAAMLAAEVNGRAVHEYGANKIKKTVTGLGHADKAMMKKMLDLYFQNNTLNKEDCYDALAVALTHERLRGFIGKNELIKLEPKS